MSSTTPSPEVATAIRTWASAESMEAARQHLREAHRGMVPDARRELELWTARISFETLVEAMSSMDGVDETRVEWEGAAYHPRQLERLAAWAEDQTATAAVLEIDAARWSTTVVESITWYRERAQQSNRQGPDESHITAARKFIGG